MIVLKKLLKIIFFFLIFLGLLFFIVPNARANFIGSVSDIISSLRGVEEEAVNVYIPSPPEPEIILGNSESEALTTAQVLFEESINTLSTAGSCDSNVGEENRAFAERIVNENPGVNYAEQLDQFRSFDLNSVASGITIDFTNEPGVVRARINRPEVDIVFKIFVNGSDFTIKEFTNAGEIIFKDKKENLNIELQVFNSIGESAMTRNFTYTSQTQSKTEVVLGELTLEDTGINIETTQPEIGYQTLVFPPEINITQTDFENSRIVEWTSIPGASYYKIEYNSKIIYNTQPTFTLLNTNRNFTAVVSITAIDENLVEGPTFTHTGGKELGANTEPTHDPNIDFVTKNDIEYFYFDDNDFGTRSWNPEIYRVQVTTDGYIGINASSPPDNEGYILLGDGNGLFGSTGWQTNWNENDPNKFNIQFLPPNDFSGSFYFQIGRGSGRLSNKVQINLDSNLISQLKSNKVSISNPDFVPKFNKEIPNLEERLNSLGSDLLYDLLGPTMIEFSWRPVVGDHYYKTKSFNIYVNGECIGSQRAWNIVEGVEGNLRSQVDLITYAVVGRLPSKTDVEISVTAVGFNGVESEPEVGIVRTFLEPQVTLLDIGLVETNWIVYNEFAYIYYHLSTTKQEYTSYLNSGDTFYLQAKMCCDENNFTYFPTIQFIPVPDYASCADLTIIGKLSKDNPAFLGVRTNPILSVTELIKSDDGSPLGFEESGGQVGDTIYSINGVEVYSEIQLADQLNQHTGGDSIELVVGRNGEEVKLKVSLTTYPARFDLEEINKATGCFNADGQAIGVFKIKMKDGFKKNQYISSFYFYQRDSSANERLGEEAMVWGGNKEFNSNGNIYSGIGPADSLVSYGKHNVDFSKASFTISSNTQRSSSRKTLITSNLIESSDKDIEDGPSSKLELFIPSETRNEPYSMYAKDYSNYDELVKKGIVPVINGNSVGDCCYRDTIKSDAGRIFPKGTYSFYFKTNNPRVLGGWDVYSESCSLFVFDVNYDYAIENPNFLRNTYYPEKSNYPTLTKLTVDKEFECVFDLSEYRNYPYIAFNAKTCYVSQDNKDEYFCIEIPYVIMGLNSFG